ncbi:MAG: hypothetical protein JXR23_03995 [Pontiellaceae bacterium]|nr:hypothetical protein [Pontiellaceae bacterium]
MSKYILSLALLSVVVVACERDDSIATTYSSIEICDDLFKDRDVAYALEFIKSTCGKDSFMVNNDIDICKLYYAAKKVCNSEHPRPEKSIVLGSIFKVLFNGNISRSDEQYQLQIFFTISRELIELDATLVDGEDPVSGVGVDREVYAGCLNRSISFESKRLFLLINSNGSVIKRKYGDISNEARELSSDPFGDCRKLLLYESDITSSDDVDRIIYIIRNMIKIREVVISKDSMGDFIKEQKGGAGLHIERLIDL